MINISLPPPQNPEQQRLITSLYDVFRDIDAEFARVKQFSPQVAPIDMAITSGAGGSFAWRNPYSQRILITRFLVDIQVVSSAGATIDIGTAADAVTSSDNLIDGLSLFVTPGLRDNISFSGANGRSCQQLNAGEYVTGSLSTTATALKAKAYAEFIFAEPVL